MLLVTVGVLILAAANTSIIGANGVTNRLAEDRVLLDWFRRPQKRYGTTHRIINLITLLQLGTIVLSGYKTPVNLQVRKIGIPIGLIVTTSILALVAIADLFTKQVATICGVTLTLGLFVVFTASE